MPWIQWNNGPHGRIDLAVNPQLRPHFLSSSSRSSSSFYPLPWTTSAWVSPVEFDSIVFCVSSSSSSIPRPWAVRHLIHGIKLGPASVISHKLLHDHKDSSPHILLRKKKTRNICEGLALATLSKSRRQKSVNLQDFIACARKISIMFMKLDASSSRFESVSFR